MDPRTAYKEKIRHVVMKVSVSLMSFYAIYVVVAVIMILIFIFSSGFITQLFSTGQTPQNLMNELPLGWISIAALFAGSLMMLILRGKRLFTTDLTKTNSRVGVPDLLKMLALIFGINSIVTLVQIVLALLLRDSGFSLSSDASIFNSYMNFSGLLYVILLGPVIEEIIFRGAILRSLEPFGQNFAIVVSSLAFGLYHLALFQGIFAFFVGIILGYCALKYSIKWSMVLHVINNGFAMGLLYLDPSLAVEAAIYLLLLILAVLVGVIAYRWFKYQLRIGKPNELHFVAGVPIVPYYLAPSDPRIAPYLGLAMANKAKPYRLAFSSAWLIVALSLAVLFTLLTTFAL